MTDDGSEPLLYSSLLARAVTIDELLSEDFDTVPGPKSDPVLVAKRLAAWRTACASGDSSLFSQRLHRDALTVDLVLERFATTRGRDDGPFPQWFNDARWIQAALIAGDDVYSDSGAPQDRPANPFEHLFIPLVDAAEARLWDSVGGSGRDRLTSAGGEGLRQLLLYELCTLCAPVLYEHFARTLIGGESSGSATRYEQFIAEQRSGGWRRLFYEKPVLLRLISSLTRQWLVTSREFVMRLDADTSAICHNILRTSAEGKVTRIEGRLSDPHRGGRSVLAVEFGDGRRVMYKPKDLRLDLAWYSLIERLNEEAPIQLRAAFTVARDGYGWTEFINHGECAGPQDFPLFFRRAGAWLALLHCFAARDMHQENVIAAGAHPVPIDLETSLQATFEQAGSHTAEDAAHAAARDVVANSVMAVGMLPAYGRVGDNGHYVVGGVASDWTARANLEWRDVNSDRMRPTIAERAGAPMTNLPRVGGRYATLLDHIDDFVCGFSEYAMFLSLRARKSGREALFDGFAGLPVRRVIRPTQFYHLLLHRLKDDRTMEDGVVWSAQAEFIARLADWDNDHDPMWPLQRAERSALVDLNVPLFVTSSDGTEIFDTTGVTVAATATSGLQCARDRLSGLNDDEIAWQTDVIRQSSSFVWKPPSVLSAHAEPGYAVGADVGTAPTSDVFSAEADEIAETISRYAIRRGSGAAWIGLVSVPDSDVSQLAVLGRDLYSGSCGIATFLAAHAMTTRNPSSTELALAAVSHLRAELRGRGAARLSRLIGVGAATGLGSIVYALTVMSTLMGDNDLLTDAHRAAALIGDDLIAGDKQLDVLGGSAGAILGLLRLYQDSGSDDVLDRAVKCGNHLLSQDRLGPVGRRGWPAPRNSARVYDGMAHGAAGVAYALAALATLADREEFAVAASECLELQSCGDAARSGRRSFHMPQQHSRAQWCHGAVGVGLAGLAVKKRAVACGRTIFVDIDDTISAAMQGWPAPVDTLCCGSLGNVELFREAGGILKRGDLRNISSRRLLEVLQRKQVSGDYRWTTGGQRFNIGLFRGLAGVGYTCLREVFGSVPNVLMWE